MADKNVRRVAARWGCRLALSLPAPALLSVVFFCVLIGIPPVCDAEESKPGTNPPAEKNPSAKDDKNAKPDGAAATDPKKAPPPNPSFDLFDKPLAEVLQISVATVTTPSKLPEKITVAPGTVVVIDKRDIELRGYSNLKDVMRDLPGMETNEFFFSEWGTQVPVRGIAGNNKIVVLVNGMRINPPGGENLPLHSDFSVRQADQIEVIYGPGSTLYGNDAISAVINVKTITPAQNESVEVGADAGLNEERDAWISFRKVLSKERQISISGYAQYHDSDLSRTDKEFPNWFRDYAKESAVRGGGSPPYREDFGLNAFLRLEVGDSSLQVWHRQSERSSAEGYQGADVNQAPILGFLKNATWGDRSTVMEGKNVLKLGDCIKLDTALTYNRYEIDPDNLYVHAQGDPNKWFYGDHKYGLGTSFTLEETARINVTDEISLLTGFVASKYDIVPKATYADGVNLDASLVSQSVSTPYFNAAGAPLGKINSVTEEQYKRFGGYAEVGWQATKKFKALLGLRLDRDTRIEVPSFTPRLGLIYTATDDFTIKYTYAQAYISPSPYVKDATYDRGDAIAQTNPNLQPEKSTTQEIALTYTKKFINLGVSGYYGRESNLIQISDIEPLSQAPTVFVRNPDGTLGKRALIQAQNNGISHNLGVDFFGRATYKNVSTWFSYSYTDYFQTKDHMTTGLQGISPHNGRFGLTWAPIKKLFLTPSLVIRSTPEGVIPGHLQHELQTPYELNFHGLYKINKHFDVFMTLRDVTDHKSALGSFPGLAKPQETFSGVLGVKMSW